MYVVHFPFWATMEFNDRESSPDPSRSDGSSVEFVVETPGSDWEDDPSTIVLSDNEEGPPKPKKKTLTEYFTPTPCSTLPFRRCVPCSQLTSSASTRSTDSRIRPRLPEPRCPCTRGSLALLFARST